MPGSLGGSDRPRLAELLAALSLATDLGIGVPPERTLRNTLIAVEIANELGLDDGERSDLYYASLLRFVGCTAFTYEASQMGGDEFAMLGAFTPVDETKPREAIRALLSLGHGTGVTRRAATIAKNVARGREFGGFIVRADCEALARFVRRFGMGTGVATILEQPYERWDGKGAPRKLAAEDISIGSRVLAVALQAETFHRMAGSDAVLEMVARRSGGWFDPRCADGLRRCARRVFERIEAGSIWDDVLDAEPSPRITVGPGGIDDLAMGFADFVDLKSPYFLGHSSGVARVAAAAAQRVGMPAAETKLLERAALLHDLGRVAVPNAVWDKRGPLSPSEWEQVRLHAYRGERILTAASALAPLGRLAGLHHERLDGSGYHRGVSGSTLDLSARILAAADVFQALTEPRPHRPAFDHAAAAGVLEDEVKAGRLDRDAAVAVAEGAGQTVTVRATWPSGLTDREVEIVRLLARGMSKKAIAQELFIAPGTVHSHVVHIYEKVGTSTRAGIALFAMENNLVVPASG